MAAATAATALAIIAGVSLGRLAAPAQAPSPPKPRVVQAGPARAAAGDVQANAAVLARLDRARVARRAGLRRADTPAVQARLAHRLSDDHRRAAASVRQTAGAARAPLIAGLESAGRAYSALARAARTGSARRFAATRREVRTAEIRLASAVDDSVAPARRPAVREEPAARAVAPNGSATAWMSATALLALMLALLGPGRAGLIRRRPGSEQDAPPLSGRGRRPPRPAECASPSAPLPAETEPPLTEPPLPAPPHAEPAAPWPPERGWSCEITWRAGPRAATFRAIATAPGEPPRLAAESVRLQWPPLGSGGVNALVDAARAVRRGLIEAGWMSFGSGSEWYAERFVWAHGGPPPAAPRSRTEARAVTGGRP